MTERRDPPDETCVVAAVVEAAGVAARIADAFRPATGGSHQPSSSSGVPSSGRQE